MTALRKQVIGPLTREFGEDVTIYLLNVSKLKESEGNPAVCIIFCHSSLDVSACLFCMNPLGKGSQWDCMPHGGTYNVVNPLYKGSMYSTQMTHRLSGKHTDDMFSSDEEKMKLL